jgi:hypothetical protein
MFQLQRPMRAKRRHLDTIHALRAIAADIAFCPDYVLEVSVARRSRFWLSRAWHGRAIEVDIAIWAIDLAIIGCSG